MKKESRNWLLLNMPYLSPIQNRKDLVAQAMYGKTILVSLFGYCMHGFGLIIRMAFSIGLTHWCIFISFFQINYLKYLKHNYETKCLFTALFDLSKLL